MRREKDEIKRRNKYAWFYNCCLRRRCKVRFDDALAFARDGYFEQARELVESANDSIVSAHREQTNLLAEEASGDNFEVSFIMIHGQDTLMTTMLLYDQVKFFIDEYERIRKIEEHIGLQ